MNKSKAEQFQKLRREHKMFILETERANFTKRAQVRNFLKHVHTGRREMERAMEMDDVSLKAKYDLDEQLTQEMEEIKREEIRDIKLRQQLRENSHELRELERKLREAYNAKALTFQIAQKKADQLEQKVREQASDSAYNCLRTDHMKFEREREEEEYKKKFEYRQELQNQMLIKEKQKQQEYENFLKEKQMLDEIAQRMHDEDTRLQIEKMENMKKSQEEIKQFQAAREMWRQQEIKRLNEENERIQKYLHDLEILQQQSAEKKKAKDEAREKIVDKIARELYEKECAYKEKINLLEDLGVEEAKEENEQRIRAEMEKKFRDRIQLSYVLDQQIKEKEEKLKQEELEDVKYRQQMLEKLMQEQRLEQMTEQRRKRSMIEIRKIIEQMMVERQQKRAEEIQYLWRLKEIEKEDEESRKQIIENERMNLLKEHVQNLIGFIPNGVLRESDYEFLQPDVVDQLKSLTVDKKICK